MGITLSPEVRQEDEISWTGTEVSTKALLRSIRFSITSQWEIFLKSGPRVGLQALKAPQQPAG